MREWECRHTVRAEAIAGLDRLLDDLETDGQDVIITRSGRPTAIALDLERYREVQEALAEFADPDYLTQLLQARREIRAGEGIPAQDLFRERGL
ncbi:MAG TPA: type II toxin-antitoxin system Phd/YefM family antitoxin [Nitrospirales bacterium]|nr:type II toxin-antitoxin system Phd/YefM family antitoxin [Nitrospirales bacterium]